MRASVRAAFALVAVAAVAMGVGACTAPKSTIGSDAPVATTASAAGKESGERGDARGGASGASGTGDAKGAIRVVAASADADALSLIRTKRLEAKAEGRVLVVLASASWCEPCRKLKEEIHAGRLDSRLGKVTLLAFDADADAERLASAGYRFQYIPYAALPGPDGRPAEASEARGQGGGAWREVVTKMEGWQSSSAASGAKE